MTIHTNSHTYVFKMNMLTVITYERLTGASLFSDRFTGSVEQILTLAFAGILANNTATESPETLEAFLREIDNNADALHLVLGIRREIDRFLALTEADLKTDTPADTDTKKKPRPRSNSTKS